MLVLKTVQAFVKSPYLEFIYLEKKLFERLWTVLAIDFTD